MPPSQPWNPPILGELGEPGATVADLVELLTGYLDWYRESVLRKVTGLPEQELRSPVEPLGWSPLGLIKHLSWVEWRWMCWGFAAEDVRPWPAEGAEREWEIAGDETAETIIAAYRRQLERSRELAGGTDQHQRAEIGGRFRTPEHTPTLGRIQFHLLQEYARHVGHLDVARELIDGETGE